MKKYNCKSLVILILIIIMTGCSVKEIIYDQPATETFLKTQSDVQAELEGIYGVFYQSDSFVNGVASTYFATGYDNAGTGGWSVMSMKTYNPASNEVKANWASFYRIIKNSNALMYSLTALNIDPVYKNRILGECYFLRGFAYFNLVRLYGKLPIFTENVTSDIKLTRPRSSVDDVYKLIFSDLKEASKRCLPNSQLPAAEKNHATKGAVDGLLSLAYLTYGSYCDLHSKSADAKIAYTGAKNYADTIILSNKYALAANYSDLFNLSKEDIQNGVGGEIIWSIRFYNIDGIVVGSPYPNWMMPDSYYYTTGRKPNGTGAAVIKVQPWFVDKYTSGDYTNDYRSEVSFLTSWPQYGSTVNSVLTYPTIKTPANNPTQSIYGPVMPLINKYKDGSAPNTSAHGNDFVYLRLAEIYLIKAEAENELNGPTTVAFDAFNKVRARARLANGAPRLTPKDLQPQDAPTKEDFRIKVMDERNLELFAEGHLLFDEIRVRWKDNTRTMMEYIFNEFIFTIPAGNPSYNAVTNTWGGGRTEPGSVPKWDANGRLLLFPIPQDEISANPEMDQNVGW